MSSDNIQEVRLDVSADINMENTMTMPNDVKLIFEFKIDGMTCVNCSQAIENAMKKTFTDSGLLDI